jgi:hypothetical protein
MSIPKHVSDWIATEEGAARVLAILNEMVLGDGLPTYSNHEVAARIEAAYRTCVPDDFGRSPREKARDALTMVISIQELHGHLSRDTADEAREHLRTLWEAR